jgi:anaerobic magnesium-protoporphyrin IX monomethyl ester cyclase
MQKRRIVLINSGYNLSRKPSQTAIPPFGLLSIAAVLEEAGFKIEFHDLESFLLSDLDSALEKFLGSSHEAPLFFGINLITGPGLKRSFKIIDFIAKYFGSRAKIVAGGPHATIFHEDLLRSFLIDIVCLGEGESTILDLARCLESGGNLAGVPGIAFKDKAEIVKTADRPMIQDISALPMYAWDKVDVKRYISNGSITVLYSRGCPYRCIFCLSQKFLGAKPRTLSPQQVMKELILLKDRYNIKKFRMVDDLPFGGSEKLLREFCDLMIQEETGLRWRIWGRINNFTLELAALLKAAGCDQIHFGIESGSERVLNRIKKDINLSDILRNTEICQKVGIQGLASFIVGFPFETKDDVVRTRQLISILKKRNIGCTVHKLTPFPATPIWDECLSKGLRIPKTLRDWEEYGKQYNLFKFPFHLDYRVKLEILRIVLLQFYEKGRKEFTTLLRKGIP